MKKIKQWFMRVFVWPFEDRVSERCVGCPCCYTAWTDNSTGYAESGCMFGGEAEGCLRSMKARMRKADAQKATWNIDAIMEGIGWEISELMHRAAGLDDQGATLGIITALDKDIHAMHKTLCAYKELAEGGPSNG